VLKTFTRANTPAYCATPPIERKKNYFDTLEYAFLTKKGKGKRQI
jgi:hypothetical protein